MSAAVAAAAALAVSKLAVVCYRYNASMRPLEALHFKINALLCNFYYIHVTLHTYITFLITLLCLII
jgi:hypothetical protein